MKQLHTPSLSISNLLALLLLTASVLQARRTNSRRLVIHVPVKVKTHHHTHTVYKVLHGSPAGGVKQTIYKLIGFSGEGGGHMSGHGTGHGHSSHYGMGMGMGHGELKYEDRHDCESGKLMPPPPRDLFYNHYARHDQTQAEELGVTGDSYAEEQDDFIDVRDAWL